MNILIVDDEMDQLRSLKLGLRSRGFSIHATFNAEAAIGYLGRNSDSDVDMVITDYLLPGMDGLDLVRAIRARDRIVPIILMTAYGEKDLLLEAFKAGCDSVIEKPFALCELLKEIERVKSLET